MESQGFVVTASRLWLSSVLPKSGLGCHGNVEALIFLAQCTLFPAFPFPEQIPQLGVRVPGSAWTDVRLCSMRCIPGSDLDTVGRALKYKCPGLALEALIGRLPGLSGKNLGLPTSLQQCATLNR